MLPDAVVAGALALVAFLFFVVRSTWDSRKLPRDQGAAGLPAYLLVLGYAGLGTFVLVTVGYPALFLLGHIDLVTGSVLQLRPLGGTAFQLGGMALLATGTALVFWSLHVIEPGTLTTTGPYARLRHPMYTGYFLVFAGVVLLTLNLLALPSLLFVPAQAAVARREEADLLDRFGGEYRAYAAIAGRFWPRWRRGQIRRI